MTIGLFLRVVLTWILFLPIPIINGLLREKWYMAKVGSTAAHQIGVLILCVVFLLYAYVSLGNRELPSSTLWLIGTLWLALTLAFEFGLGLAAGRSWSEMLSEYMFWKGKLWPLVPLITLLSPHIIRLLK